MASMHQIWCTQIWAPDLGDALLHCHSDMLAIFVCLDCSTVGMTDYDFLACTLVLELFLQSTVEMKRRRELRGLLCAGNDLV